MARISRQGPALQPIWAPEARCTLVAMEDSTSADASIRIAVRTAAAPDSRSRGPLSRLFPAWTWSLQGPLLLIAVAAAAGTAALIALAISGVVLPLDISVERAIQSISWGPLALSFPIYSWVGDAKGAGLDAAAFVLVLLFNRRAWLLAIVGALTGGWYLLLSHVVLRPRPTVEQVLRVTEHPGASSFPSGHTIFVATVSTLLMLCLGHRYLPGWAQPLGWLVVAAVVFAGGISRIYTGAHWPSDVLAGLLIAIAWLALVVSVRWISGPALAR
jgi:membrane-associated phospholipid phosphatase